jgi:C4-dicarboxylate-specific signal transduction histidine kinase
MFQSVGLPRGFCFLWNPGLLWLHMLSDSLIALAYFLIPIALVRLGLGRKDFRFNTIFFCASAFLVACGLTHVMEVVTLWRPVYWASGTLKAVTAAISMGTLALLWRMEPLTIMVPGKGKRRMMARANRRMASVLESTTICVMAMDSEWKVNYVNSNARKLLNAQGDMLGMTLWDAFPVDQPATREVLLKVMETRQPATYEKYYEPLNLSVTVQAHPWDEGGVAIFFSDISEQKRIGQELEWEHAQRGQRIEVLARLSSGLAHEIKNPLAIIHARASDLAEMIADGETPSATQVAKTCASIVQTSDRAIRIMRGVAAMARVATHDPMLPAGVNTMIGQAVDLVQGRYKTRGVALETNVPAGLPMVDCREVQISQILVNLLNNAFDAVDGEPRSERWVRLRASIQPGTQHEDRMERLQIDVIDGGPGVAPEHRDRLMQTFFTTKSMGAGIGIGLSVSRAIAEEHGGQLELRESDGHTCFRLTLPAHVQHAEGVAA